MLQTSQCRMDEGVRRTLCVSDRLLLSVDFFLVAVEIGRHVAGDRYMACSLGRALRFVDIHDVLGNPRAEAIELGERAVDDEAEHPLRMIDRDLLNDAAAHGYPVDMRAIDAERIHQTNRVLSK